MFKYLKLKWEHNWLRMVGDAERFSLEARIFHAISMTVIFTVFIVTIYNFLSTLYHASLISAVVLLLQIGLYALSRYKGKSKLAVILTVIQINVATSLAYFYNDGAGGSILLLFVVSLYLIFLIIPRKKLAFWYVFNLILVFGVLSIEYFYPDSIQKHYSGRMEWLADIAFTYFMVSAMIAVGTIQLRKSYRSQKERAEEKARKLESMNKEKDKLFSIIAHDLNTPLNSLQQYLQLINEMELNAEERSEVEQNLATSLSDAQYLLGNLLEWAKKQLHHAPMNLTPIAIYEQLLPTLRMFEQIASRKNIMLIVDIDQKATILADKNMFDLVVRNLLNNAVKFTNINGKIWVSTIVDKSHCVLVIKDNGIGISPERQNEIFSLNIASSYGTMNEKGTGLGLVLCKDFIVQQGGDIWFTSTADEGTAFYVKMQLSQ
ncbi:MAG: HAMP domain-containing sensor histidine kinase [Candidatus Pedobacter colombiensis]|uniref:histidine kinase n=1 Tax=Candidatus Pedobacter colombiensis TaxID=3121371 RepID=A0AAJ5WD78_9SPHI|nr:HAMP domain-containing sensor histidine kinase [Pedobacter sp.]WEK21446.1 MAG: HAMP domain-containing sensor histidine kinase [Pedobacter sp.]